MLTSWLSTDVWVRSVYGRLYNVWSIETCLRRCVHDWRPRRGILLTDMDDRMIFGLVLLRFRRYTDSLIKCISPFSVVFFGTWTWLWLCASQLCRGRV
uniref:Uncharacterized protein n=1 Tax=Triticum urartu TaxID=4572 RepID=A0A8R7PJA5_TRIUA